MKYLLAILLTATIATAAPVVLYSPVVVDSVSGDTGQPALLHTSFIDTATASDTMGYSITEYMQGHRWPDSVRVKLHGIGSAMRWTELAPFMPDSVEGLEGYRRVWWSGATMLEDSVIVPGLYQISGDSLLPFN